MSVIIKTKTLKLPDGSIYKFVCNTVCDTLVITKRRYSTNHILSLCMRANPKDVICYFTEGSHTSCIIDKGIVTEDELLLLELGGEKHIIEAIVAKARRCFIRETIAKLFTKLTTLCTLHKLKLTGDCNE